MKNNKSIKQVNSEVYNAKQEALKRPQHFEVENTTGLGEEEGNLLSDVVTVKERLQRSGKQTVNHLKDKIERIFHKFPHQYEVLGLYYSAGFTLEEIAVMKGDGKANIRKALTRATVRLKRYLSVDEFSSIRWALGVRPKLDATPRIDDSEYDNCKSSFAPMHNIGSFTGNDQIKIGRLMGETGIIQWTGWRSSCDIPIGGWAHGGGPAEHIDTWRKPSASHPPKKNLPIPRMVLWQEQQGVAVCPY